jgi:hypothetical protein
MKKKEVNWTVVILSFVGLGFIALTFLAHWLFIIPAVIIMIVNQKILFKEKKKIKN